jgi:hypothetical protein
MSSSNAQNLATNYAAIPERHLGLEDSDIQFSEEKQALVGLPSETTSVWWLCTAADFTGNK